MDNFYRANLGKIAGVIAVVSVIAGGAWLYNNYFTTQEDNESVTSSSIVTDDQALNIRPEATTQGKKENNVVEVIDDFLIALENIYFASTYTEVSADSVQVDTLRNLMRQNDFLSRGKDQISKYLSNDDEYISTVAEGITQGASAVIEANNKQITFLRNNDVLNVDTSELQYQVANYLNAQKKGYELIFISSPFLIYVVGSPAKNENPTGEIPYKISREERQKVLNRIDQLFGDGFQQLEADRAVGRDMNAIMLGVENLRNNLSYNTYEEASAAAN